MNRFHKAVFAVSLLMLCWYAMMAVHEMGHVIGAWLTHGKVLLVELHPFAISRTDVFPNPRPGVVVWLGPIFGCLFPMVVCGLVCRWTNLGSVCRSIAIFFAGFCFIANGAYIGAGAFDGVGDCGVMLENGSPLWSLVLFGIAAFSIGLYFWHRLGSVKKFFEDSTVIEPITSYVLLSLLLSGLAFSFASMVV